MNKSNYFLLKKNKQRRNYDNFTKRNKYMPQKEDLLQHNQGKSFRKHNK